MPLNACLEKSIRAATAGAGMFLSYGCPMSCSFTRCSRGVKMTKYLQSCLNTRASWKQLKQFGAAIGERQKLEHLWVLPQAGALPKVFFPEGSS